MIIPSDVSSVIRTTLARGDHDAKFSITVLKTKIDVEIYKSGALVKLVVDNGVSRETMDLIAPTETHLWILIGYLTHKGEQGG